MIPCTLKKQLNEKPDQITEANTYTLSHDCLYRQVNQRIKTLNM